MRHTNVLNSVESFLGNSALIYSARLLALLSNLHLMRTLYIDGSKLAIVAEALDYENHSVKRI